MTLDELRKYMMTVVSGYFTNGTVFYADQKMSKHPEPYITLKFNNVARKAFPIVTSAEGKITTHFDYHEEMEINLFTKGKLVGADNYENTSMSDLMDFIDYIESNKMTDELDSHNVTMLLMDGYPKDLSGIINETLYRYRSNVVFRISCGHDVTGMYGQSNKTVPNPSGGGKQQYVDAPDEWFDTVEIEEEE